MVRKGSFPGQEADAPTVAVVNILEVHRDAGDGATFERTRALIGHAGDLAGREPLFEGLDRLLAEAGRRIIPVLADSGAPQHPAAARAFREAGLLA